MRRALAVLVALMLLFVAGASRADDAETARTRFAAGVRLYDAHDYAAALTEFQAAYAAKRSPQIKRNIALCLKGLGRHPEAIVALEEMLAEGGDTLKPDARQGAERAIAEMAALVATVRLRVVYTGRSPPSQVTVTVDGVTVTPEKVALPIRLMPGEHVFVARAPGYFEAQQHARLAAGPPETVLELGLVAMEIAARGRLVVQTNVMTAQIAVDGIQVGVGSWAGDVPVGSRRIDVTAQGYPPHTVQSTVQANAQETVTVDMTSVPSGEPEARPAKVPRLWYVSGGLGLYGETLTFAYQVPSVLDVPASTKKSVGGGGLIAHVGRLFGPNLALGVVGEVGGMTASNYASSENSSVRASVTVTNWVLAPEIRVRTNGKLRAFGGFALGLTGQVVNATVAQGTTGLTRQEKGSGGAGVGLLEGGGQLDFGRAFVEAAIFGDVHGIGSASGSGGHFFADSPTVRAGLRLLVGYTF